MLVTVPFNTGLCVRAVVCSLRTHTTLLTLISTKLCEWQREAVPFTRWNTNAIFHCWRTSHSCTTYTGLSMGFKDKWLKNFWWCWLGVTWRYSLTTFRHVWTELNDDTVLPAGTCVMGKSSTETLCSTPAHICMALQLEGHGTHMLMTHSKYLLHQYVTLLHSKGRWIQAVQACRHIYSLMICNWPQFGCGPSLKNVHFISPWLPNTLLFFLYSH